MRIRIDVSNLKQTRWHECVIRFVLGGLITAAAGWIGKKYGASVGGLFLAFPAILPAGATLIDKHEKQKKQKAGVYGRGRARQLVSVDAAGAAMGSAGLFVFALIVEEFIQRHVPWFVIGAATLVWISVSVLIWDIRKRI
jgi:hypothetical protein